MNNDEVVRKFFDEETINSIGVDNLFEFKLEIISNKIDRKASDLSDNIEKFIRGFK